MDMADTMSTAEDREAWRDAVLAGDMTPDEAVAQLDGSDPWRGAFEAAADNWGSMAERPEGCVLPPVDERRPDYTTDAFLEGFDAAVAEQESRVDMSLPEILVLDQAVIDQAAEIGAAGPPADADGMTA